MTHSQRELLRLHVEAVWGIAVPPLDSDDVALAEGVTPKWVGYHARLSDGDLRIWRAGVSSEERAQMAGMTRQALDGPAERIQDVTREVALQLATEPAITYAEAQRIAQRLGPETAALAARFYDDGDYLLAPERAPVVGVIVDGRLLSVAHSSRRTAEACELGIDTLPDARRCGYALAATIVWTRAVLDEGLIPFYSAFAENTASLALAAAAGYREFAKAAYITR